MRRDDDRALRELEERLAVDDAPFVQRFHAATPGLGIPAHVGLLQVLGALTMAGLMLLAGSAAGAMAFTGAATAVGLAWWHDGPPAAGRRDRP